MEVISGGAETIERVQLPQGSNRDEVQGYYFSKVPSAEEMNSCLSKTNRKLLFGVQPQLPAGWVSEVLVVGGVLVTELPDG